MTMIPDTSTNRQRRYRPSALDDIEDIEEYRPGGFHPVCIGDDFADGRYRVLHKLGYGGFATVWLARDVRQQRNVALKILTAESSLDVDGPNAGSVNMEVSILNHLRDSYSASDSHPGQRFIASILDYFTFRGANGTHLCLVSEMAGPSVVKLTDGPGLSQGSRRMRADLARRVALQAAQAMSYLHSQGVVHSDFTPMNILFRLTNADTWSEAQVYEQLGEPIKSEVLTSLSTPPWSASAPAYVVEPPSMLNLLSPSLFSSDILVIDFGTAFFSGRRDPSSSPPSHSHSTPPTHNNVEVADGSAIEIGIPAAYAAPEVIFDSVVNKASDVWALACTIFHMRAGFDVFESYFGGYDEAVQHMVRTLGKLPDRWWRAWEERKDYIDDSGKPKLLSNSHNRSMPSVKQRVSEIGLADTRDETNEKRMEWDRRHPQLAALVETRNARPSEAEIDCMSDLLDAVFKYQPEQRSSAQRIAGHSWFMGKW